MKYKTYTMEDALDAIIDYRGKTPKKSESGIPTLSAKTVRNNFIDYNNCYYISEEEYKRFMVRGFPKVGDILLTTEAPLGMTAKLNRADVALAQRLLTLRGKSDILDNDYLLYFLQSPKGQHLLKSHETGTTVTGIKQAVFRKLEISIPSITIQKQIAIILSSIDEKISVNTKINENLEQQAQAIFKSWFVDFEPFGGIMPDDWRMGTLSEIAEINSGKRPPMRQADKTDNVYVPLVGAASVMGYTNESNHSDKILVIGRVGTHGIVQRFNIPCWTSDNTLVLTSPYYEYTYQVLKRIDYTAMNRGSTQPLITQGDMNKAEIFLPDEKYILKYESLVGTLFAQYEHNRAENENLAALRDTLLPKLMNGEIDVSEVNI